MVWVITSSCCERLNLEETQPHQRVNSALDGHHPREYKPASCCACTVSPIIGTDKLYKAE